MSDLEVRLGAIPSELLNGFLQNATAMAKDPFHIHIRSPREYSMAHVSGAAGSRVPGLLRASDWSLTSLIYFLELCIVKCPEGSKSTPSS